MILVRVGYGNLGACIEVSFGIMSTNSPSYMYNTEPCFQDLDLRTGDLLYYDPLVEKEVDMTLYQANWR